MKKIMTVSAVFAALGMILFSCTSTKKATSSASSVGQMAETSFGDDSFFLEDGSTVSDSSSSVDNSFAQEETLTNKKQKETKEEKKARKEREKLLKKQKTDQYTGWVYIPEHNFTITNDDVRIVMKGSTGSFGLYVINEKGSQIPLIVNYDSYNSTFVAVKIGRKTYRLNRENGVKCEARRTPYGAQMAYTIAGQAQIVVDFSFLPSIATSSRVDMIRVTIYTINLGKHTQSFTSKAVFDTTLGENSYTHFSTASRSRVDSEMQFITMNEEKWVRSSNEKACIQFLLDGKGITPPQFVTLSSKDNLSGTAWVPQIQENKSFNSVISYNNSALGINWKTAFLDPLKTDINTFYISVAADGQEPAGKKFLAALEAGKTALSAKLPDLPAVSKVAPSAVPVPEEALATAYRENMPVISSSSSDFENGPLAAKELNGYSSSSGEYDGVVISADSSDDFENANEVTPEYNEYYEYIQSLIDRIEALENDDENINQQEIESLNAELDEILVKLR